MKFAMSDGRVYTDYQPNCSMNTYLQSKYAPELNQHAYRAYLQRNTDSIIKDLSTFTANPECDYKSCPVCKTALEYKPKA